MLVLTRREGEQIVIGGNVKITVVQIKGGTVRIGIEAPREILISRVEPEKREKSDEKVTPNEQ
jgi:carbon storage regulator